MTPKRVNRSNRAKPKQKHQPSKSEAPAPVKENYGENLENDGTPYVKIVEQPASRMVRFRYKGEKRTATAVPGINTTPLKKTYPSIEIIGYKGDSVIVVSCVSKDAPYRPHPYNLTGKEGCKKGVCTIFVKASKSPIEFNSLGVECVKRKGVEESLKLRQEIRVDPFRTGFAHATEAIFVDMTAVRFCFQVFIEDSPGRFTVPLKPVVSDPIYDSRVVGDLKIYQMCSSSTVLGDKEVILLCDKISKEKTNVRFYEEKGGEIVWQSFGDFQPSDVHKRTAIKFYPPQYHNLNITEPVQVYVQLVTVDGFASEPWPFKYLPIDSDEVLLKRKCKRIGLDIGPDSKKEHASSGDIFRDIIKSWSRSNISSSPSTHSNEDINTEISSSDESSKSSDSSIPKVLDDMYSCKMENSEDSNESVANRTLQVDSHKSSTNSMPSLNYQQQKASSIKSPQNQNFLTELQRLQQQHLSMKSPHSLALGVNSAQLQPPEHQYKQKQNLSMSSSHQSKQSPQPPPLGFNSSQLRPPEHQYKQKKNLSMSSPHQSEQSPQPPSLRFDSPQLQLLEYQYKQKQNLSMSSCHQSEQSLQPPTFGFNSHQPQPLEQQYKQKQNLSMPLSQQSEPQPLNLRFDSPLLQLPEHPAMESHYFKQQRDFSMLSPHQSASIKTDDLKQQNQLMPPSQQQLPQWQQHLVKHSPLQHNFPMKSHGLQQQQQQQHLSMQSHLQGDSLQLKQKHPQEQSPYQQLPMEFNELKDQQNYPIQSSQGQQSLHLNTLPVEQNLSGQSQHQYLRMNSPQQQQQHVSSTDPTQPLSIQPQQLSLQLQQLQSLMLMSNQLQKHFQQQQSHYTQQQHPRSMDQQLLQQNHNTAPLQEGTFANALANAFATLLDNYQAKFQELVAATTNTMLQSAQWNVPPPTNNTENTHVQLQSMAQQPQQEITPQLEQQQLHQDLTRAQNQQQPINNTNVEGTPNYDQSIDQSLIVNEVLNLEENADADVDADADSILSDPLWAFDS